MRGEEQSSSQARQVEPTSSCPWHAGSVEGCSSRTGVAGRTSLPPGCAAVLFPNPTTQKAKYLRVHLRSRRDQEAGQPRPGPRYSRQGGGGPSPSPPYCGECLGVDSAGAACRMWAGKSTLEPVSPQYSGDKSGSRSPPNRRARTLHNTPPGEDCSTAGVGAGQGLWVSGIQRGWRPSCHPVPFLSCHHWWAQLSELPFAQ